MTYFILVLPFLIVPYSNLAVRILFHITIDHYKFLSYNLQGSEAESGSEADTEEEKDETKKKDKKKKKTKKVGDV